MSNDTSEITSHVHKGLVTATRLQAEKDNSAFLDQLEYKTRTEMANVGEVIYQP